MGSTFTRRQFVMGAMVLGGSLALTGCSPKPESKKQDGASGATEPVQADIIVIGSGLAGSACSISAAQNGASVLLVDKAPFLTSTFLTSKGNVSIAQVPENKDEWRFESETPDTMDQFVSRYRNLTEIGKVDVDEQGELAMRYGVMSIPTVIFFKDGKEIDRKVGVMPAGAFTQVLDQNL